MLHIFPETGESLCEIRVLVARLHSFDVVVFTSHRYVEHIVIFRSSEHHYL